MEMVISLRSKVLQEQRRICCPREDKPSKESPEYKNSKDTDRDKQDKVPDSNNIRKSSDKAKDKVDQHSYLTKTGECGINQEEQHPTAFIFNGIQTSPGDFPFSALVGVRRMITRQDEMSADGGQQEIVCWYSDKCQVCTDYSTLPGGHTREDDR